MKVFFKVVVVAFFASTVGLSGCDRPATSSLNQPVEASNVQVEDAPIPVVLPTVADVMLKGKESKSGRLTAIDGKQLMVENSGSSATVAIAQIEKVTFKGDIRYYSNGQIVIRGQDEPSASDRETWSEIPLNDFQLQDPNTGVANVKLTASAVKEKILGIKNAKHLLFVVQEMSFDPASGKMTLKVLKLDR